MERNRKKTSVAKTQWPRWGDRVGRGRLLICNEVNRQGGDLYRVF